LPHLPNAPGILNCTDWTGDMNPGPTGTWLIDANFFNLTLGALLIEHYDAGWRNSKWYAAATTLIPPGLPRWTELELELD